MSSPSSAGRSAASACRVLTQSVGRLWVQITTAVFRGRGGCGIVQRASEMASSPSPARKSAQIPPPSTNLSMATVSRTRPWPSSSCPPTVRSSPAKSLANSSTTPSPENSASNVTSVTPVQRCQ